MNEMPIQIMVMIGRNWSRMMSLLGENVSNNQIIIEVPNTTTRALTMYVTRFKEKERKEHQVPLSCNVDHWDFCTGVAHSTFIPKLLNSFFASTASLLVSNVINAEKFFSRFNAVTSLPIFSSSSTIFLFYWSILLVFSSPVSSCSIFLVSFAT